MKQKYCKPRKAAEITGIPEQSLANRRSKNYQGERIPFIKIGKSVYYAVSDLEKFMEAKKCSATIIPEANDN